MGCTQSKPSHNSRSGRRKRSGAQRSKTSAQPVRDQISSKGYKVDEPNYQADVEEFGEMSIPEENQAIQSQRTESDNNPVTQLQSDTTKTGTENDVGGTEQQHVGRPLQVPGNKSDLEQLETQINPEVDVAPTDSLDTQKNSTYAHDDLKADKYNIAPSPAAPSSNNGRNIPMAKKSSVYKRPSFPRSEARGPENYVDETNKKRLEYGEYIHEVIPVQQEDIQVHRQGGQRNVSLSKYQVLRESELLELDSSKAIITRSQMYKVESSPNQDQSTLNDPGVQESRTEVDVSRQLDSSMSVAEEIGSICIDARTGEYKFYQRSILIGYVDKEEALSLSNDWPICPGTTVSRFQPEGHVNIKEHPSSTMNDFPIASSRSYDISNHQVRRGYSSKQMDVHCKSNTGFSDQFLREQVGQSIPEYRGYYM